MDTATSPFAQINGWAVGGHVSRVADEGSAGVEYAYGDRLQRLQALKALHDPANFFHGNNIAPHTDDQR